MLPCTGSFAHSNLSLSDECHKILRKEHTDPNHSRRRKEESTLIDLVGADFVAKPNFHETHCGLETSKVPIKM